MENMIKGTQIGDEVFVDLDVDQEVSMRWTKLGGPETWPPVGKQVILCCVQKSEVDFLSFEPRATIAKWSPVLLESWTHWADINFPS